MFTYLSNNLKKLRRWKIRILLNGKKNKTSSFRYQMAYTVRRVQVWLIVHFETSLFHLLCIILSVNVMKFAFWDTRVTLNRKKNPIRETTDWPTFSNHLWHETCVSKCCFFAVCLFSCFVRGGDLLQIIKISNFCGYNFQWYGAYMPCDNEMLSKKAFREEGFQYRVEPLKRNNMSTVMDRPAEKCLWRKETGR